MPFDLRAERVLPLLESGGARWAVDARSAWDWLTASGDSPVVSLHDLEYFLWYQLPAKFLTDVDDHRAVAVALADLLSKLGYEAAAALCRGTVTMRVLAEWHRDRSSGYRALRQAIEESGVEPPDTDTLEWGSYMGMTEAGVFDSAANALEQAILDGKFTPGRPGWKAAQGEVLRRFLTTPVHALGERTPQVAVWEERQQNWAERPGRPLRQVFMRDVKGQIRRPPDPPKDYRDRLRPLLRLLETISKSPQLTQAGYLPPTIVRALAQELDWGRWDGEPRSEAEVPAIMVLRELAKDAGFIRKARGRLVLTAAGRHAIAKSGGLWDRLIRGLAAGEDFNTALRELLLVRLLKGAAERGVIEGEILPVLVEAGWKPSDGRDLTADMVSFQLWDAIRPMNLLGMIEVGEWPGRGIHLSDFGGVAARAILWHRSSGHRMSLR